MERGSIDISDILTIGLTRGPKLLILEFSGDYCLLADFGLICLKGRLIRLKG